MTPTTKALAKSLGLTIADIAPIAGYFTGTVSQWGRPNKDRGAPAEPRLLPALLRAYAMCPAALDAERQIVASENNLELPKIIR